MAVRALACLLSLAVLCAVPAHAQDAAYPSRIIRIVVGFAAGGGNDIFARIVGQKLQEVMGQTVVIENKPGAGGRLAAEYVAGQPADGYTVLVGATGAMSIAAAIYPRLPYHPTRSFAPLTMIGSFPLILTVGAAHPAKTVQELIAYAKAHPAQANYATSSPAFTIPIELFKLKAGVPGHPIPYKSSNESMVSLLSGQTMFTIADPPPIVPLVKGGQVRALAVTGAHRVAELPDVPSMAEVGLPEVKIGLWSGLFAPTGGPPAILQKLEADLRRVMQAPDVREKLKVLAVEPGGIPAQEFRRIIDQDIAVFSDVVRAANLKFED